MTAIDWLNLEQWDRIPCFPKYEINRLGQIRSRSTKNILKGWIDNGYSRLTIGGDRHYVHQIVAMVYLGKRPDGTDVIRHLDGNPQNNAASNLAYGTYSENMLDRWDHGTMPALAITECPQGHPFAEPATPGCRRTCPICRKEQRRQWQQRQRGKTVVCEFCGRTISALNIKGHQGRAICLDSRVESKPIDWDDKEAWGQAATCVHIGSSSPDAHDASEEAAEARHEL